MSIAPTNVETLHHLRFPSRRSAVMGTGAMVATSQPIAAQSGLQIMRDGGNAFDAAVATAAMLNVVEPTSTGIGGDCFALLYLVDTAQVKALNGSGRAPAGLTRDELERRGHSTMPTRGALSVTVPGTVDGWSTLLEEHGQMSLADVLEPAIRTAENGYPVSELIAAGWAASEALLSGHAAAEQHYLWEGRAPQAGHVVRLPALAHSLRRIAEGGPEAFYEGPIAEAIAEAVQLEGGVLTVDDLSSHTSTWDGPISTTFRDMTVWECPPNGQGLAALVALGITDGLDMSGDWGSADHLHHLIVAMQLGLAEARAWVGDPSMAELPVTEILSDEHFGRLRARIERNSALPDPTNLRRLGDDTVYLTTVDEAGNACSFINSNYMGFGSGLVAGDTGIALQNRGAGFVLDERHPNSLEPGKRPYHTIIPAMVTRSDGSLFASFGVMGGHMQPQGHLQVLVNLLDYGMDPQRALDAPRFQITTDGSVALEPWFEADVRADLVRRGHRLVDRVTTPPAGTFGGGQIIAVTEDGVRVGGSDPRKDGCVAVA